MSCESRFSITHLSPAEESQKLECFYAKENSDLFDAISLLRVQVWSDAGWEFAPKYACEKHSDQLDERSYQIVVNQKGRGVIAATRATFAQDESSLPYPDWFEDISDKLRYPLIYIGRLAVATRYQNQGLGYYLDTVCIESAKQQNLSMILCDVPENRVKGLKRRNFRVVRPPAFGYVFPTIGFTAMILDISETD